MTTKTVLLVDDNESFRQSTSWLLQDAELVVKDFANAQSLLAYLSEIQQPLLEHCVVTDLRMPNMSGLELMEELRELRLNIPVVMITGHGDVPLAVEAMRRGAAGFIEKPFNEAILVEYILAAMADPGAVMRNPAAARARLEKLSPRERQVLEMVCSGKLNKTIADVLGISIKTVELHRSNMVAKLGTRSIQELVRLTLGYE